MLGAVVGVVERPRHRILVRRVRLAVRVRRQQRRVFRHVRPEGLVPDAARIAEHEPVGRVARGALRLIRDHHADHRVPILAQFGVGLELEDVGISGRHVHRERHRRGCREIVGPHLGAVRLLPNDKAAAASGDSISRSERDESGPWPAAAGGRCRGRCASRGSAAARAERSRHDSRVPPDDHRRRARAGSDVVEDQVHLLRSRGRGRRVRGRRVRRWRRRTGAPARPSASRRRTPADSRRPRLRPPGRRGRRTSWARW